MKMKVALVLVCFCLYACGGGGGGNTMSQSQAFTIHSKYTSSDYPIRVAVPNDYTSSKRYPAIFVLDSEWNFEGAIERMGEYADQVIVVGVGNNSRRNTDYVPPRYFPPSSGLYPGAADRFLDFITRELVPHLDGQYSIDAERRILSGHSLGGLFTEYALLAEDPSQRSFHGYLAGDSSDYGDPTYFPDLEARMAAQNSSLPVRLYCGGAAMGNNQNAIKVCNNVAARNYPASQIRSKIFNGTHESVMWPVFTEGLNFILADSGP